MKKVSNYLLLLLILLFGAGCVTKKKKSDTGFLGKLYHNTTARYNGYFNANELVEESIVQLETQNVDDYNNLLSIYPYATTGNVQGVSSNLDDAIKKVTVVVSLHPQSHWVDDCYLLAGKAEYLKRDYEAAEEMLRYMVNEFDPDLQNGEVKLRASAAKVAANKQQNAAARRKARKKARKKREKARKEKRKYAKKKSKVRRQYRKKVNKARRKGKPAPPKPPILITEEEGNEGKTPEQIKQELEEKAKREEEANKPENYFMKHRPAYQEGVLWLARTLIERNNYEGALRYMEQLETSPKTFDDVRAEIPVVKAYMYVKREQFENAIEPLQKAVAKAGNRNTKGRYSFILGQIYQRLGDGSNAFIAFENALRYTNDYEMEFSCRLNMAQNAWASGQGSSEDAIAQINGLIKDERNLEYEDRLYYALAKIALEEGDQQLAVENLRLSLSNSIGNKKQKAEAYLLLADMYLEDELYLEASFHYDSTLTVMPKTDERYPKVEALSQNLTEIAENLQVIQLQDSLLRIGSLSEEERAKLAMKIIKEREQQNLEEIAAKANNNNANTSRTLTSPTRNALQKESFFFAYDDRAVKRGQRSFERKWGDRPLEDNWRRSSGNEQIKDIEEAQETAVAEVNLSEEEVENVLADVPVDEQSRASAELKIQKAMFELGTLYRDRLENYEEAITVLERLLDRFPESSFKLDAWYYLYLLYREQNQISKSQQYADLIVANYPSSTYAQVIKDPNYIRKLKDDEVKLNLFYDRAYANFKDGKYREAKRLATTEVAQKFGAKNKLEAKFALLAAMCMGNERGKPAYIQALQGITSTYPETPEATKAKEMLRLLGIRGSTLPGGGVVNNDQNNNNYKVEDNVLHYLLVVFNSDVRLTDIQNEMSDYNQKYYQLEKFRYSQMFLGRNVRDGIPVLVIRRFKNKEEGMKYYEAVSNSRDEFIKSTSDFDLFLVSQNNYREILRSKSLAGYKSFFETNYLQ